MHLKRNKDDIQRDVTYKPQIICNRKHEKNIIKREQIHNNSYSKSPNLDTWFSIGETK